MIIKNSTLTGNSAGTACSTSISCRVGVGGAFYTFGGAVTLNNSTVAGNSAYRCSGVCSGTGGAIVNGSGNLAMNNSTVSGNSAGGIFNDGTATLQNSIVANNSDTNCGGTITSHGYNLSSDGSCAFSNSGDRNNTNAVLGTLGYYGGPTPTIPLLTVMPETRVAAPTVMEICSRPINAANRAMTQRTLAAATSVRLNAKATSLKHATLRRQIPTRSVGRMLLPRPGFFQRYAC